MKPENLWENHSNENAFLEALSLRLGLSDYSEQVELSPVNNSSDSSSPNTELKITLEQLTERVRNYLNYSRTSNKNVQLVLQHCCLQNKLKSDVERFNIHVEACPDNKSG